MDCKRDYYFHLGVCVDGIDERDTAEMHTHTQSFVVNQAP